MRTIPPDVAPAAIGKLDMIEVAHALVDLRSPPENHLEVLRGGWRGSHSIRINA